MTSWKPTDLHFVKPRKVDIPPVVTDDGKHLHINGYHGKERNDD